LVIYQESLHDARSTKYKVTSVSNSSLVSTISSSMRAANSCGSDRMRSAFGCRQLQFTNRVTADLG